MDIRVAVQDDRESSREEVDQRTMNVALQAVHKVTGKGNWVSGKGPSLRLRASSSCWNLLVKYGPHSELFFFLVKNVPVALTKAVEFRPSVLAETLKAFLLIGLHLLAAEDEAESSGSLSHDLGNMW